MLVDQMAKVNDPRDFFRIPCCFVDEMTDGGRGQTRLIRTYALVVPPPEGSRVALYYQHSDIWWDAFMALVGLFYCTRYNPFRHAR